VTDRTRALGRLLFAVGSTVAWVAAGTAVTAQMLSTAARWPEWLTKLLFIVTTGIVGVGGLWAFWNVTWAYAFYRRGYRVRWVAKMDCAYEEFSPDGMLRSFVFQHRPLADIYAPPCEIAIPEEADWDTAMPTWAGRREQIAHRLTTWAQAGYGRSVTFVRPGSFAPQS
jgi:hypothetical protein